MGTFLEAMTASPVFLWLIKATLIVCAGCLVTSLMKKSGPRARYAVWVTVFVSLAVLPMVHVWGPGWNLALPLLDNESQAVFEDVELTVHAAPTPEQTIQLTWVMDQPSITAASTSEGQLPAESGTYMIRAEKLLFYGSDDQPHPAVSGTNGVVEQSSETGGGLGMTGSMAVAWFIVASLLIMRLLVGRTVAIRMASRSSGVSGSAWQFVIRFVNRALGLRRTVRFVQNRDVTVPLTFGVARPVVMLPRDAVDWDMDRKRIVLLHECIHIKRLDDMVRMAARIVAIIHWFNPLVWWAFSRLKVEQEKICDLAVLNTGIKASDYATHLVALARGMRPIPLAGAATLGMAGKAELSGRLTDILKNKRVHKESSMKTRIVATVAVLIGLGLIATMNPTVVAASWDSPGIVADTHMISTFADEQDPAVPVEPETPAEPEKPETPEKPEKVAKVNVWVSADEASATSTGQQVYVVKDGDKTREIKVKVKGVDGKDGKGMVFISKDDGEPQVIHMDQFVVDVDSQVKQAMEELEKARKLLNEKMVNVDQIMAEVNAQLKDLNFDDETVRKQVEATMRQVEETLKKQSDQHRIALKNIQKAEMKLQKQMSMHQARWFDAEKMKHIELEKIHAMEALSQEEREKLHAEMEAHAKEMEAYHIELEKLHDEMIVELDEKELQKMKVIIKAKEGELRELEHTVQLKELAELKKLKELEKIHELHGDHNVYVWHADGDAEDMLIEMDNDYSFTIKDDGNHQLNIALKINMTELEKGDRKKIEKAARKLEKSLPGDVEFDKEVDEGDFTVSIKVAEGEELNDKAHDQLDKALNDFMDTVADIKGVDEEDVREIRIMKKKDKDGKVVIRKKKVEEKK